MLSYGRFPLSSYIYVRTCVKFTFTNKREAMSERSREVKVEPRLRSFLWIALRISTAHNIATLVTQSFKMATVGVGTKSTDKRGFFCKFKRNGKTREVKKYLEKEVL